jgi:two-component system, LuxR family, response regulator FixJ
VFIVDDDAALCESLALLLESHGFLVQCAHSAEEFLAQYAPGRYGCLLLDIRMRGASGLELQERLNATPPPPPIIVMTGHGDIPMAVRAMRAGAFDFLEKPVTPDVLLERVAAALATGAAEAADHAGQRDTRRRLAELTPREREVLAGLLADRSNREIGVQLGIAERTVEVHRRHILHKMDSRNVLALVRRMLALRNGSRAAQDAPPGTV